MATKILFEIPIFFGRVSLPRRHVAVWLVAALAAEFAAASLAAAGEAPAELQGTWKLLSVESGGETFELPEPQPRLVIKGERMLHGNSGVGTFAADAATTPRTMDLTLAAPKQVLEGIYQVDGNTLKICVNKETDGARERPAGFATKDRASYRLLVLERDKPETASEGLRGFVGLQLGFDKEQGQVSVNAVLAGAPAMKAGLQKGDVVLKVGGTQAQDLASIVAAVRQARPGSSLDFRIRRGKEERDVAIKVQLLPFEVLAQLN
jgi:uncharacterized protein (TIGR03067 family)